MAETGNSRASSGADPLLGRTIGSYKIQEQLGRGGMGSVYKAEHQLIGKKVAIKVLLKEFATNELLVQRFFNEARAVNKIGHDNIVDISDYGKTDDGWIYYVMELLEGRELTKLIKELTQVPLPRAIHIIRQCALALDACHKQGIIHRDLKPDNIFLITHGGREDFVKILDFGVAKLANEETGYTRQGAVLGTPHYMSPEQAEGRPVDQRTDVYALGIIMYRLLTGRVPFPGTTFSAVIVKVLTEPARPPRALQPSLPPAMDEVILKSIAKDPGQRYNSSLEFLEALERAANLDPLASEALASPVKAPSASTSQVTVAGEAMKKSKSASWANGLPRLPDETLDGARTQAGMMPVPANNSGTFLAIGISVGVALALGVASLLVLKPWQSNNVTLPNNNPVALTPNLNATASQVNPTPNTSPTPIKDNPTTTPMPVVAPKLVIESEPPGAALRKPKDKVALGFTPFTIDLPTEATTFTVSLPGFESVEASFDPSSKQTTLKATLTAKLLDDKSLLEQFKALAATKDGKALAEGIAPEGFQFFRSGAPDGKIFTKDKVINTEALAAKTKEPMLTVTRDQLGTDKKLFGLVKQRMGSYYDEFENTSFSWSCVAAELYCTQKLPIEGGGFAYSKALFSNNGKGLYLTHLLVFTNPQ
jgi:eukaryotic-like serine/threonine-protein kinase